MVVAPVLRDKAVTAAEGRGGVLHIIIKFYISPVIYKPFIFLYIILIIIILNNDQGKELSL
jgi:hypothetical protein